MEVDNRVSGGNKGATVNPITVQCSDVDAAAVVAAIQGQLVEAAAILRQQSAPIRIQQRKQWLYRCNQWQRGCCSGDNGAGR